ncbi:MAG: ComF family protein [Clostridiales bacterium]|nr:ComF family protein [Clostridiales bacterium]
MLRELGGAILDWIYPPDLYCIRCGKMIESGSDVCLCKACEEDIRLVGGSRCRRCGKPMDPLPERDFRMRERTLCGDCLRGRVIRKGVVCMIYDGKEREMIHRFKFEDHPYYGAGIAALMAAGLQGKIPGDVVVMAVPMHRAKRRRRGYDQAQVLGKALARHLGRPFYGDCLVRAEATAPMMSLGGHDRLRNVSGAFTVRFPERFRDEKVLLVDDIYTTGSTVDACGKALLAAGAKEIYMVSAASGYGSRV